LGAQYGSGAPDGKGMFRNLVRQAPDHETGRRSEIHFIPRLTPASFLLNTLRQ